MSINPAARSGIVFCMARSGTLQSRVRGCLLGGAIGDALGAPVEFMSLAQIQSALAPKGFWILPLLMAAPARLPMTLR